VEEMGGESIDQDVERGCSDTIHDPVNERKREARMNKEHLNV